MKCLKTIKFHSRMLPCLIMGVFLNGAICCGRKEITHDHDVARQLFEKSVRMITVYTDSIKTVSDSATLLNVVNNFNIKITALNFEFPPDTDLELSEDENDSLIALHKCFINAIQERYSKLANPSDSIAERSANDSLLIVR